MKTNSILADIYDILSAINNNLIAIGTRKKAAKVKQYPRPKNEDNRKIGKDALPLAEMKEWIKRKINGK